MQKKELIVEKTEKIANILQNYGFTFADVNKILRNKDVKVNGKAIKENLKIEAGDSVVFYYSDDMLQKKFDVVFEDDQVCVLYKKAGIESDGEGGIVGVRKDLIAVHRLDRNTEGLMVYAKNSQSEKKLLSAIKNHLIHKTYIAEAVGSFDGEEKVYVDYLLKDNEKSLVKIFPKKVDGSVEVRTGIKILKKTKESSLLQIDLLTGRTHQIRAHLAYLGHPIIGDGKYGKNEINKKFKENKQKLACFRLKFDFVDIPSLNFKEFTKRPKWDIEN